MIAILHKIEIKGVLVFLFSGLALAGVQAQSMPVGTLPNGKTLYITYDVTVNAPLPAGACTISNQASVSGNNFTAVTTDDPDVGGVNDPTLTDAVAPPALTCPAALTVMADDLVSCSAMVNSIDAVFSACASPALNYSLSGATTGVGAGQASGQAFNAGSTQVAYTVTDGYSQSTSCQFTVTVSDCNAVFSGTILWEQNVLLGVNNATVNITGSASGYDLTDINGDFMVTFPSGPPGNFTIKPVKNINRLNGVTVGDALAIQQHVTGINPILNPYRQIAADINRSNSISTLDAALLNQCLLNNPAANNIFSVFWRFVPQSWSLGLPPWGFPEQISLTNVSAYQSGLDFYGVKIGDVVNGDANPANFGSEELVLRATDRTLKAGESFTVAVSADAFADLAAWQFALRFDPQQLRFLGVETLAPAALPLTADNFGLWQADAGEIRCVWSQPQGTDLPDGAEVFRLNFEARNTGVHLRDVLQLDADGLPALAYTTDLQPASIGLRIEGQTTGTLDPSAAVFRLMQNRPNPFSQTTTIGFVLPEACDAQLRVLDVTGRELWRVDKHYPAGYQEETIRVDIPGATGVLYYELTTPFGTQSRKMTAVRL